MEIGVAPDGALLIGTDNVCSAFAVLYMKYTSYGGIGLSLGTYCWTFHCFMAKPPPSICEVKKSWTGR